MNAADDKVEELPRIWPGGIDIEVFGVTGDYGDGKTLIVNTIDPVHTRSYDFEKSSGTYASSLGFERVDVPAIMLAEHPHGYRPIDTFQWWIKDIRAIEPGKYSVISVDTIGDIEAGLADYVASKHSVYGFSSASAFRNLGGVFWGHVKEFWKMVLVDLAARCQTFAFTTHLRTAWKGGRPTSVKEPKGKTTLMELATVFLWLQREKPKKGDRNQQRNEDGSPRGGPPSAEVIKSRLAKTVYNQETGEAVIQSILPPRLPIATPAAIRKYITNPPNYDNLKATEKVIPREMTDQEKLELEAEIAENKRAAEESALERLNRMADLGKQQAEQSSAPAVPQPTKPTHDAGADNGTFNAEEQGQLLELVKKSGTPMANFMQVVERLTGAQDVSKLNPKQATELTSRLQAKVKND